MDFENILLLQAFQESTYDDCSAVLAVDGCVYQPLPAGHIRLLHIDPKAVRTPCTEKTIRTATADLLPGTASPTEDRLRALHIKSRRGILKAKRSRADPSFRISCTLSTHSLSTAPQYVALSYTWGRSPSDCEILLNGRRSLIRKNLWRFLLEAQDFKRQRLPIWVDALCVDQSDKLERADQVQMMPQIFHKAASALIWLGPSFAGSDQAMNDLNRYEHQFSPERSSYQPPINSNLSVALMGLCSRAYWTRLWIYQEIQLAQRKVLICGKKRASWSTFCDVLKQYPGSKVEAEIQRSIIGHTPAYSIVETTALTPRGETIFDLMHATQHLRCAETRDKIFALLGLSCTSSIRIVPDYKAPVAVQLNLVLRAHHDLHPPKTLDEVQRQCARLEQMMDQSSGSMLALYPLDKRLPPSRAAMRQHPLRQEHHPFSLWWCDHYQHYSIAALLLKHQDTDKAKWCLYAAQDGNLPAVEVLLRHGVKASGLGRGISALGAAASRGHVDIVRLLLREAPCLQLMEYAEECVLAFEVAAFEQHHAVMQVLLESVPHVNGSAGKEARGRAMVEAAAQGSQASVQLLLHTGSELAAEDWSNALKNAVSNGHTTIALSILHRLPKAVGIEGLLHAAASAGNMEMAEILLDQAAPIDQLHQHHTISSTPLYAAVSKEHIAVVMLLIRRGADVHKARRYDNYAYDDVIIMRHRHAIYTAAESGNYEMVELLLDAGVGINEAVLVNWNAFLGAVERSHALYAAAQAGHEDIVSLMLDRGADIIRDSLYLTDQDGVVLHRPSMLLTAAVNKHFGLVDLLFAHGAEAINAPCTKGRDLIEDGRLAAADAAYMAGRTDLKLRFLTDETNIRARLGLPIARAAKANSLEQGPAMLYLEQATRSEEQTSPTVADADEFTGLAHIG